MSGGAAKCQISGLTKRYDSRAVVDDVSLSIDEGEFIVILGPSGCGKTTTLRLVAGLMRQDAGRISIDGRMVSAPEQKIFVPPEHRNIGMVFQSYAIWPHMTVFENVAYPLRVRRVAKPERRRRVQEVLELVGLSAEIDRPATALSGGQMQRVALARALVANPSILLFDEPLSNLDLKLRERLRIELKALQKRSGITSVYVTHDQGEAVELADRIVVMEGGKAVQVGAPQELYQRPRTRFVAEFISSANIFDATVEEVDSGGLARVVTASGRRLLAAYDGPVATGQRVDVVIHPEDCAICSGAAIDGHHPVRVIEQRFQGTSTRYTVEWGGAPFDVVTLGTDARVGEGTEAGLLVTPERARIIGAGA